ncbi:MAG TPA: class I SAM-dependent methyltransferase, partial [bacterium]|nr:class I SAM-dependent methyltransferase [bacterium]
MTSPACCRYCTEPLSIVFADLGVSPLANSILAPDQLRKMEPFFPLQAFVCQTCHLVQLEEFETPEGIFRDYSYFSSYSDTWLAHCQAYARRMCEHLGLGLHSKVVEIASNDGYLLQYFQQAGVPVLGVEPAANVAKVARARGIPTEVEFFGRASASRLAAEGHQADLIVANNVLAHVPDINDFVAGFHVLLKERGVATFEFPHLLNLIEQAQFDTIYHEHFSYLSLGVIQRVFASHALTVFDVEELPTHGGSLRVHARPQQNGTQPVASAVGDVLAREDAAGLNSMHTYSAFQARVVQVKLDLLQFLLDAKKQGRTVVGYGAPAKGNTLLNYCGIGPELLAYTVDRSPHKQSHFL